MNDDTSDVTININNEDGEVTVQDIKNIVNPETGDNTATIALSVIFVLIVLIAALLLKRNLARQ